MIHPLLLAAATLVAPASEDSPMRRAPPVDQCAADPSFTAFRETLVAAIERRDAAGLLALVADNIETDFGGGGGRDDFAQSWRLDQPEQSPLWQEMSEALALGCAIGEAGDYWSPSLFLEREIDDPFATFLVVTPGAALHAAANAESETVAVLQWDLIDGVEWQDEAPWWRVRLADGREGFVRREDLRSPIDYRAGFEHVGGRWQMVAFIAGD